MSYHLTQIPRGKFGQLSKVYEEVEELKDAEDQGADLMVLQELSDIIGAIKGYLAVNHPTINLNDLDRMSNITARAFQTGHRKPKS